MKPEAPDGAAKRHGVGLLLDRWLVGSLLIVIASVQLGLTQCARLSPWKGGGFGMFAVIDAPGSRLLCAEGIDAEGRRYRLDPWSSLPRGEVRELQSFPSEEALFELGQYLVDSEFVGASSRVFAALERLKAENPEIRIQLPNLAEGTPLRYRVRRADDPEVPGRMRVRFVRVELQMWRLRFDPRSHRIWSEPILRPVVVESGSK